MKRKVLGVIAASLFVLGILTMLATVWFPMGTATEFVMQLGGFFVLLSLVAVFFVGRCPECGWFDIGFLHRYCPHCGAKKY